MSSHGHHHGHSHGHMNPMNSTHSTATPSHGGHHGGMLHETGHSGQHMLFFHLNNKIVVLFEEWEIRSTAVLIGSCVAIFVLALLYEGLKQCRERHARYHTRSRPQEEHDECDDPEKAVISNGNAFLVEEPEIRQSPQLRIFTCFHLLQTFMHIVQLVVGYSLMLVVMTYNVWLCLAVVAGAGLGYFIMAGLLAERVPRSRPRAKKSRAVFVLKKQTRKEAEDSEKVEETTDDATTETTDDANREKKDEKDDNQNTASEEGQTGNGNAVVDSTGNGSAVVDHTGNGSAVVDNSKEARAEKETKELESTSEDQNVEVDFGEEKPEKGDPGKENPAFEADPSTAAAAETTTE